jgi:hypothetical protein
LIYLSLSGICKRKLESEFNPMPEASIAIAIAVVARDFNAQTLRTSGAAISNRRRRDARLCAGG